ncbi:Hypothetical protein AA314_01551 [Archangium gephyra]|uniref:Uncharacterized protein n=1 Tax=Archangium gephyra TaxID=48 RepID=A0AAC8TBJ0_9BACT|nr:Hypothetical protein AA314_01551 [Archangium gephyra]
MGPAPRGSQATCAAPVHTFTRLSGQRCQGTGLSREDMAVMVDGSCRISDSVLKHEFQLRRVMSVPFENRAFLCLI